MKISIAISILILALAAAFGWRGSQRLEVVRKDHSRLVAEAAQLGIAADTAHPAGSAPLTKRTEREDQEKAARLIAKEFIAFAREMEAAESKGQAPDEAAQKRIMEILDRLMSLDGKQLKILIAEVRATPDLKDDTREGLIGFSVMSLASEHPQAALALFTESADIFTSNGMGEHLVSSSLGNWAKSDPAAALAWVRANSAKFPDLITQDAKRGLIQGAATNDPRLAFKLIGELGIEEPNETLSGIARAAKTPEARTATFTALREYLATINDEEARKRAAGTASVNLGSGLAADGFESATKWLDSSDMTPAELESVVNGISGGAAKAETGRWVGWISEKLPADKADNSIRDLVRQWTRNDYQAAGTWLGTMPEGPAKNTSVRSYAETISKYEPEAAAQWAVTLPPGKERDRTLRNIYHNWPKKDEAEKAAAEAFKAQHGIE
ncbi:hypothetical protein JIN84_01795 [Luteolibacter yonseiensis]|uniref:Uncharacterized protein n=1 Tax=Luteolibacter yonseiensis TaxID=1144680 RepID=A0A934V9Z8_9BACT|nr:hypothetical protein [Luteolibacter yonseiensis]MBK1814326.1 hypothetical protein [Luteolibacter yonseiensis]